MNINVTMFFLQYPIPVLLGSSVFIVANKIICLDKALTCNIVLFIIIVITGLQVGFLCSKLTV